MTLVARVTIAMLAVTSLVVVTGRADPAAAAPGCDLFPRSSFWYAHIDELPIHRASDRILDAIGRDETVHPDFGSGLWDGGPIGIPYDVVPADQPTRRVRFLYADESDGRRYPIPRNPSIEGGPDADGDRHILLWQPGRCRLYELFDAHPAAGGAWRAGSGAIWRLDSDRLRPDGWTSADAAGLAILPGLVRYDEVATGEIDHAIRITVPRTRDTHVWPARHDASSSSDRRLPPMGTWLRLDPAIDPDDFGPQAAVVVRALQEHGAIIADNGSAFYLSGVPDERWDNDDLRTLSAISGADFEVVSARPMMVDPDLGTVRPRYRD